MESKNLIIAISLSLLVFIGYVQFFAPPPQKPVVPVDSAEQAAAQPQTAQSVKAVKPAVVAAKIQQAAKGKDILIETDLVKAVVNTAGGVITHWELKEYREADKSDYGMTALYHKIMGQEKKEEKPVKELGKVNLLPDYTQIDSKNVVPPLTVAPLNSELYKLARVEYQPNRSTVRLGKENPSETLVLTYRGPAGIVIEKSLTFYNNDYKVEVGIKTKGLDGYTLNLGTDFGFADKISSDASGRVGFAAKTDGRDAIAETVENIQENAPSGLFAWFGVGQHKGWTISESKMKMQSDGVVDWFAQQDKYFTAALLSGDRGIVTSKRTTATKELGDLLSTELTVKDKAEARTFTLYAGPKSFPKLQAQGRGLEQMVDYGWFSIIAKPMFWLMRFFYDITHNYGIAIILLTIVVRILLFYPSLKSALSMEEMKKIQPQIAELKEKYKKDPARMSQETMKLYKEHKVNPLGGCLPMLLQLPFFVALYNVLSVSIELRQEMFIPYWIKDLSVYDPYYILPVLMGLSMVLMMKMTTTSPDPQQEKMMMAMNVLFIFLFAWLPAGLLVYITLSNVLSIAQQMYVHRIISKADQQKAAA